MHQTPHPQTCAAEYSSSMGEGCATHNAGVTQLAECRSSKPAVPSSILGARSIQRRGGAVVTTCATHCPGHRQKGRPFAFRLFSAGERTGPRHPQRTRSAMVAWHRGNDGSADCGWRPRTASRVAGGHVPAGRVHLHILPLCPSSNLSSACRSSIAFRSARSIALRARSSALKSPPSRCSSPSVSPGSGFAPGSACVDPGVFSPQQPGPSVIRPHQSVRQAARRGPRQRSSNGTKPWTTSRPPTWQTTRR
jgi:hypothetical protein